jgi:signal transduction histidine kinase
VDRLREDPRQFALLVSHELREPVSAIQSFLNVVIHERTGSLNELQAEFLRTAEISARRLARRIDDLQVVLAGGDALELRFREVDLNQQILLCCRELAWAEERYSVSIDCRFNLNKAQLICWADPDRIDQILLNLIENAVKYAPENSTVRIWSGSVDPEFWEVVVENASVLPPDADTSSWFEPFQRAEQAQSVTRSGLGLGLTIAEYLAHAHDGEIWATQSEGRVKVGLKLPRMPASSAREAPQATNPASPSS